MKEDGRIVEKAMLLAVHNGRVLLYGVRSQKPGQGLVRPPGGHVELGELSSDAVKREIKEEMNTEVEDPKLLATLENIFTDPDGDLHHEIVFVYSGKLKDRSMYDMETVQGIESGSPFELSWIPIESILSGKIRLVPKGLDAFLRQLQE